MSIDEGSLILETEFDILLLAVFPIYLVLVNGYYKFTIEKERMAQYICIQMSKRKQTSQ